MFNGLLKQKSQTIASAAIIVASFSILSRFVGFIRDRILAGTFGASDTLDIYFAAFSIPDLFFQLLVVGALSASFIPLFTKYYDRGNEDRAWALTNTIVNVLGVLFGLMIVLAVILAPILSMLVAPGFSPEKQAAVASLSQVMFLGQFFLGLSMVYGSALQGAKRFFLYSLAPVVYNVGIIVGVLFFVPIMGTIGLGWGVVFGGFLHLLLQTIGVHALGYRYRPLLRFQDPDVLYTLKHMVPRVLGLAVNQLNFVGMTVLASMLAAGSVAMLRFAYNLNFFSIGVVAVSYAVAAFPTFCALAQRDDKQAFQKSFSQAARQIIFFIIPATVLFIALRAQIVRLVLGAGAFDWPATITTADTLGAFALSFLAQSLVFLLVRAYFAFENTRTPFFVGMLTAAVNLSLAYTLLHTFGVQGFGVAYSVSALLQMILLWIPLSRQVGSLDEWNIARSFVLLSIAGLGCAIVTQATKFVVVHIVSLDTFFGVLLQTVSASVFGLLTYFILSAVFKSDEMYTFTKGMHRRFFARSHVKEEIVTEMG